MPTSASEVVWPKTKLGEVVGYPRVETTDCTLRFPETTSSNPIAKQDARQLYIDVSLPMI